MVLFWFIFCLRACLNPCETKWQNFTQKANLFVALRSQRQSLSLTEKLESGVGGRRGGGDGGRVGRTRERRAPSRSEKVTEEDPTNTWLTSVCLPGRGAKILHEKQQLESYKKQAIVASPAVEEAEFGV